MNHTKIIVNQEDKELDLNELGAKLIKAELMEGEEMIIEIKQLIEIARKRPPPTLSSNNKEKEENKILIASRTDRFGNEMPIRKEEFERKRENKKEEKFNQYSKDGKQIDK